MKMMNRKKRVEKRGNKHLKTHGTKTLLIPTN